MNIKLLTYCLLFQKSALCMFVDVTTDNQFTWCLQTWQQWGAKFHTESQPVLVYISQGAWNANREKERMPWDIAGGLCIFYNTRDTHTHTQPFYCWSGICPGPPGSAGTRKVKPRRLNQSGFTGARDSEWQWPLLGYMQVCNPCRQPRQHPTTQFFTGRMPFLTPSQQRQSTEGKH